MPRNPLFRPVAIRDVILASQYGILDFSAVSQYAENNLITPKTAKLMYQMKQQDYYKEQWNKELDNL